MDGPGTILAGKYELVKVAGTGGMATVWRALQRGPAGFERPVGVKLIRENLAHDPGFVAMFVEEARVSAQLIHPNIVQVYDFGEDGGRYFLVMEWIDGMSLSQLVRIVHDRGAATPWVLVAAVAMEALRGLAAAHERRDPRGQIAPVFHRDVTPQNILLSASGVVKLSDFGLARATDRARMTAPDVIKGKIGYLAPELTRAPDPTPQSDMYSLGATVFHLLTGAPPFEADSPIALILKHLNEPAAFRRGAQVPDVLRALVLRMLEKDPERRFPSYDALLEQLERAARGEAITDDPPRQVFVLKHRRDRTTKRSLFRVGKLSIARTNLKMGRRDKAVMLLRETLSEEGGDSELKSEAALLLLEIFEQDGDQVQAAAMAETVAAVARDPAAVAYASWKLAMLDERGALDRERSAMARYERILKDPPEGLPRALLESQVKRLKERIDARQRELGTTQVLLGDEEGSS